MVQSLVATVVALLLGVLVAIGSAVTLVSVVGSPDNPEPVDRPLVDYGARV